MAAHGVAPLEANHGQGGDDLLIFKQHGARELVRLWHHVLDHVVAFGVGLDDTLVHTIHKRVPALLVVIRHNLVDSILGQRSVEVVVGGVELVGTVGTPERSSAWCARYFMLIFSGLGLVGFGTILCCTPAAEFAPVTLCPHCGQNGMLVDGSLCGRNSVQMHGQTVRQGQQRARQGAGAGITCLVLKKRRIGPELAQCGAQAADTHI